MVTGLADLRTGSQTTFGASVVYVVELTSGKIIAYGLPWNRASYTARMQTSSNLVNVGMLPFRNPPPPGPTPKIGGTKAGKEREREGKGKLNNSGRSQLILGQSLGTSKKIIRSKALRAGLDIHS